MGFRAEIQVSLGLGVWGFEGCRALGSWVKIRQDFKSLVGYIGFRRLRTKVRP